MAEAEESIPLFTPEIVASEPDRGAAEAAGELEHILPDLRPLAVRMDTLNLDPNNSQNHDPRNLKVIAESLTLYKQRTPLTVNKNGLTIHEGENGNPKFLANVIEKGNGTYIAAKMLGWVWIAIVGTEDDPINTIAYGRLDNRASELSGVNYVQAGKNMRELQKADHPVLQMMYTEEEALPLMREDFQVAPLTEEQFDATMLKGRSIRKVTASERLVIDQAIELCRAQCSKALTEGAALEKICREYLEITAVTTAVNSDIGGGQIEEDILSLD